MCRYMYAYECISMHVCMNASVRTNGMIINGELFMATEMGSQG